MEYLFKGCTAICSLPGTLCKYCGEACKQCPSACKCCADACKNVGTYFKGYMETPLSAYAFVSLLLSLSTMYSVWKDASEGMEKDKKLSYAGAALGAVSIINIFFAFYLQWAVWQEISSKERRPEWQDGDLAPEESAKDATKKAARAQVGAGLALMRAQMGGTVSAQASSTTDVEQPQGKNPGKWIVTADTVKASFNEVFMKRLSVLFMFFLLLGTAALPLIPSVHPPDAWKPSKRTEMLGASFFILGAIWSCLYLRCSCCAKQVTVTKPEEPESQGLMADNSQGGSD